MSILKAILNSIYLNSNNFVPQQKSSSQGGKKKKRLTLESALDLLITFFLQSLWVRWQKKNKNEETEELKRSQEW